MGELTWVRLARRLPGVVRQPELANLEALIEAGVERPPARNLFILSCAIPAGIATFGGLSVFAAWVSGTRGMPLALGTGLTLLLSAAAWFTFYRLYLAIPPSTRHLRDLILKFSQRYVSIGNIFLGEKVVSDPFAALLDEAAGIYLQHGFGHEALTGEAVVKAERAMEEALSKLLEISVQKDPIAQDLNLSSAASLVEEMRLLNQSLRDYAEASKRDGLAGPLSGLREARAELETNTSAQQELDQHLKSR